VEEQASGAQAVVKAMERMRELIQQSTSGSTELAASAEQMSKMSRELLEAMERVAGKTGDNDPRRREDRMPGVGTRHAAAGARS
jgi:hypothetical protein